MPWVRGGECSGCGDCCRGNPFPDDVPSPPDGMCPLLGALDRDGRRLCTKHTTDYHYYEIACQHWPSIPAHTADLPRCTYTWAWRD